MATTTKQPPNPAIILGLSAIVIGGIIYFSTRKKKEEEPGPIPPPIPIPNPTPDQGISTEEFDTWLSRINSATTITEVDGINTEVSNRHSAMTDEQYTALYNAYVAQRNKILNTRLSITTKPISEQFNYISVDGEIVGSYNGMAPLVVYVGPGSHTISIGESGTVGYKAPQPIMVQVALGETKQVVLEFIAVTGQAQITDLSIYPNLKTATVAPGDSIQLGVKLKNLSQAYQGYSFEVYIGNTKVVDAWDFFATGQMAPGLEFSYYKQITVPSSILAGTHIVKVNVLQADKIVTSGSGVTLIVQSSQQTTTLQQQLASIWPYIKTVWVWRAQAQEWAIYDPVAGMNTVGYLRTGEVANIEMAQAASFTYGGQSQYLSAGWNVLGWIW